MTKSMIVRCRECWIDIGIQPETRAAMKCPKNRRHYTYFHARVVKARSTRRMSWRS